MNNNKSAEDHYPENLYQQYRTMPATTEEKIDATIASALACRTALLSQTSHTPAFSDIVLDADEQRVLDAYREFQSLRSDAPAFDTALEDDVAKVMSKVTPMIHERAPQASTAPRRTPQVSWTERVRERVTGWTAPLGAMAMAAVAAVAISLFSATDTTIPSLGELNGIAAYEHIDGLNLSNTLSVQGASTLGFSAGQEATAASYAAGALGGELSIAMSGNDRTRSEAILGQISLLATTATALPANDRLITASNNLKLALNNSSASRLLDDAPVADGLRDVLKTIQTVSADAGTMDLTLLGSWAALTSTLVKAAEQNNADPRLKGLIERAVSDAGDLHQRLVNKPGLSEGQRKALDAFIASNHDLSNPSALRELQSAIRNIDTSFRV